MGPIKKLFSFFILVALLSCQSGKQVSAPPVETDLMALSVGEKMIQFEALSTLIPEKALDYRETVGSETHSIIGFPLHLVLDAFMGSEWRELDAILFTTLAGHKTDIPVSRILRYRPVLAYRFADSDKKFQMVKDVPTRELVELGPYYLVWDNSRFPELVRDGNHHWPYQVVRVDAIRYASQFARNLPFLAQHAQ